MKTCTSCLLLKPLTEFNKRKGSKDGLRYECRICHNQNSKAWQAANPDKRAKHNYKWGQANKPKKRANWTKYHASKTNQTPPWITREQLKEIEQFYIEAEELQWLSEEPLEVDHIVPLQGKNVSGLHVPWNLQILPKGQNVRKSNK